MNARSLAVTRSNHRPLVALLVAALALALSFVGGPARAVGPSCQTSSPAGPSYSVKVCLTAGSGTVLTGNQTVQATVTVPTGTSPGLRKVEFYIDGDYLLTDFQSPYTFTLPTATFLDGSHSIWVDAILRDGNTASSPAVTVSFSNGVTSPPPPATGFQATSGRPAAASEPFVVAATGDGASGRTDSDNVVGLVNSWDPNLFLYLGDVYEKGTATEFYNWYGVDGVRYGKFKSITNPIVGNHEYENGVAQGYFDYWSGVPDYYSYDAGGWHFVALNSNSQLGEFEPGTAQYDWLASDLAAHPGGCTLAYFHHPVLSVGPQGNTAAMNSIWRLMAANGVDVVLAGHDHQYQRWEPLDGDFQPAAGGITEFVAGGGGHGVQATARTDHRVAAIADTTGTGFGALRLELSYGSALYSYVNPNGTLQDSGQVQCSGVGPDGAAPSVPGNVSATTVQGPDVTVAWSSSTDDRGVGSYEVRRGTATVATLPPTQTSWVDTTTAPLTTYEYSVRAVDLSGNASAWSEPVVVTTPDVQTAFTWQVSGDAYVDATKPTTALGLRPDLRVDDSPVQESFLRFVVSGIGTRAPSSLLLRVHPASSLPAGFEVRSVSGSWQESTVTYETAPAVGSLLATSGPVTGGSWVEIPLAGLVSGDGTYDVALVPLSSTALKLDARESGAPAELVGDISESGSNAPPVAVDVSVSTQEDTAVSWAPQVYDADSTSLTCSIETGPTSGQATVAANCSGGTYTPAANANGSHSFTYRVSDGTSSATATVTVTVGAVNDPPVAAQVSGSTWTATSTVLTLAASDVDGDCPLTFEVVSPPGQGTLSPIGEVACQAGTASVAVTYTAPVSWTGQDSFTYLVRDPSGAQSQAAANVDVTATPTTFTVQTSADAFVDASNPTANYGSRPDLRLDASPVQRTFLRFTVSGLGSTPASGVTLRVHAASNLSAGFDVRTVSGSWTESTVTYSTAPTIGSLLGTSGPVTTGTWVEITLPPQVVPADGTIDLALTPLSTTALRLDSRETTNPAELRISR